MSTIDRVRAIIAHHLNKPIADVTETVDIFEDLGGDDLDRLEIVMEVERAFGVAIDDASIEGRRTPAAIAGIVDDIWARNS